MNGRTNRSSNVNEDKRSTNKKRKSAIGNNHRRRLYNTNNLKYQNAVIANSNLTLQQKKMTDTDNDSNNRSMGGKLNSFEDNRSLTSDSELSNDSSKDYDDELTNFKRKDKRSKREFEIIMGAVMEIKESNKVLREEVGTLKDLFQKLQNGQETTPFRSVVTVEERKSLSDITTYSQNTIDYFKKEKKTIGKRLKVVILQYTFARAKFLIDRPEQGKGEETPTAAEKVVLKAIEMKQVNVPVGLNKVQFIRNAAAFVKQQYNIIWSQVQQNLRKRWFGKF